MRKMLLIAAACGLLAGCLSMAKMFGYDYRDPNNTIVLMTLTGPYVDSAGFKQAGTGKGYSLFSVANVGKDCMVLGAPLKPGSYEITHLFHNSANTYYTTYQFTEGDKDNLRFKLGSPGIRYIGAYEVGTGKKSFTFQPTRKCGGEKEAVLAYQKEVVESYTEMQGTVWPGRFKQKLRSLGVSSR